MTPSKPTLPSNQAFAGLVRTRPRGAPSWGGRVETSGCYKVEAGRRATSIKRPNTGPQQEKDQYIRRSKNAESLQAIVFVGLKVGLFGLPLRETMPITDAAM